MDQFRLKIKNGYSVLLICIVIVLINLVSNRLPIWIPVLFLGALLICFCYLLFKNIKLALLIMICIMPFLDLFKQSVPIPINIYGELFYLSSTFKDLMSIIIWCFLFYCIIKRKIILSRDNNIVVALTVLWLIYISLHIFLKENIVNGILGSRSYIQFIPILIILIAIRGRDFDKLSYLNGISLVSFFILLLGFMRYYLNETFLVFNPTVINIDQLNPIYQEFKIRRLTSLALNPNELGIIITIGLVYLISKIKLFKLVEITRISLLIFGLLLTFSRSAILGFLTSAIILFILEKKIIKLICIIILFFILININNIYSDRIASIKEFNPRLINWAFAIDELKMNDLSIFIGKGINSIGARFVVPENTFTTLDNFFLHVLYELGVIGLAIFVILILSILIDKKITNMKTENKLCISLIIGILISNIFSPTILTPWGSCFFWALLGLYRQ